MNHNKSYTLEDDSDKFKPVCPQPKKIILECGEGTGSRTFTSSNDMPFQLAFVTVDTTSLNRPDVLIKFSSLVRLEKIDVTAARRVRLKYELLRTCNGEEPQSLGTWMFEKTDSNPNQDIRFDILEESFNFILCESLVNCLDCCIYFVKVSPLEIINSTVTVGNGQIAALTQTLCSNDTILECGQGNGSIIFKDASESALLLPADIAHVTIDTTFLNNPKVLIEFSCMIKLAEDIDDAELLFQLFRVCGDSEPILLDTWNFELRNADELIGKSFSFIFCECEAPSQCCDYFVKVIPIEIDDDEEDDVTVYNGRITALAQSSKKSSIGNCTDSKSLNGMPKEVLLKCGNTTGNRAFTSVSELPFQMAQVTIDTSSFCRPIVNIEFSSIVSFQLPDSQGDTSIQLRYELFRKCDNRGLLSLGIWELQLTNENEDNTLIETTESFNFTFCDHIICPDGCCDYFVTVTTIQLLQPNSGELAVATVSNGRIAALVQEGH